MRIDEYLELLRREGQPLTLTQFARRCGLTPQTLRAIRNGGGATASSAVAIISATQGLVSLHDLIPDPGRSRRRRKTGSSGAR